MPLSVHWFLPTAGDSRDVVGFEPTTLRFLVAFRPGFVSPTLAAQQLRRLHVIASAG